MKNYLKERVVQIALLSLIICCLCSAWYFTRCGIKGLMTWHIFYRNLFRGFFAICLIPVITIIPYFIWNNKVTTIISYIFSGIATLGWVGLFVVLSIMNTLGTPVSNINALKASDPLPVHQVAANDTDTPVLRLGLGSDPHWGSSKANAAARTKICEGLSSSNNDAVFLLGDIAEMGILAGDFEIAINEIEAKLNTVPLRVLPGNHDTIVCSLPHFKKLFNQKDEPDYYRMDGGNIHILVLRVLWDEHEFSKKQEEWLVSELESIPQEDTVIVLSHSYFWGSGYYDDMAGFSWGDVKGITELICPILEKYNVDLAISGHDHFFEYLENANTAYTIIGTMGGALDAYLGYTSSKSKWINNTTFGWLEATIYTDRIELDYVNEDGMIIHTQTVKLK